MCPNVSESDTDSQVCELCGALLEQDRCPVCSEEQRAHFRALKPGVFPATALPPLDMIQGPGLANLRRALADRDLVRAEELWENVLGALQPLGPRGRAHLSECFDACAAVKEALGKSAEAAILRRRAVTARKDPSELTRGGGNRPRTSGWDQSTWLRLQSEEGGARPQAEIDKAFAELEAAEARSRRKVRIVAVAAGGFGGLWLSVVTGIPAWFMVLFGAGMGWIWVRKR